VWQSNYQPGLAAAQQSFRFYDLDPEQLKLPFDYPEQPIRQSTLNTNTITANDPYTSNSSVRFLTTSGNECMRIDSNGMVLSVKKSSWLKRAIGKYLGITYESK
tara:strand:+ start:241 stop:552 length:312 start_codon:yes stop_codon:yes gene_type:complete